jgi:hypothetical protein
MLLIFIYRNNKPIGTTFKNMNIFQQAQSQPITSCLVLFMIGIWFYLNQYLVPIENISFNYESLNFFFTLFRNDSTWRYFFIFSFIKRILERSNLHLHSLFFYSFSLQHGISVELRIHGEHEWNAVVP